MARTKNTVDYINNSEFYQAMVERNQLVKSILKKNHIKTLKSARKKGLSFPPASDYIGSCILKIAQRLIRHQWFSGYTVHWKEEMIGDAIENCLLYLDNFNPKKTKNPFAYFSAISWYAFRRRIEKEKKHQYIKMKSLQQSSHFDNNTTQDSDDKNYTNEYVAFLQKNMSSDIITTFEAKKAAQKQKLQEKKLESSSKGKGKLKKFLK